MCLMHKAQGWRSWLGLEILTIQQTKSDWQSSFVQLLLYRGGGGDRAGACICSKYPLRRQDTGFARPESCLEIKDGEPVELLLTPQATSPEHEVVQKVKGGLQLVQGKRKEWPVGWALTVTYINFTKEIKKEVSEMTNENSH